MTPGIPFDCRLCWPPLWRLTATAFGVRQLMGQRPNAAADEARELGELAREAIAWERVGMHAMLDETWASFAATYRRDLRAAMGLSTLWGGA